MILSFNLKENEKKNNGKIKRNEQQQTKPGKTLINHLTLKSWRLTKFQTLNVSAYKSTDLVVPRGYGTETVKQTTGDHDHKYLRYKNRVKTDKIWWYVRPIMVVSSRTDVKDSQKFERAPCLIKRQPNIMAGGNW